MAPVSLVQLLLLATAAAAQKTVTIWGQCGGQGYTGSTQCGAGNFCTVGNPWYSQCVPGTPDDPLDGVPDAPLVTNTAQTTITIGNGGNGGGPIIVTTSYTYLSPSAAIPSTTIYGPHHTRSSAAPSPRPTSGGGGGGSAPPSTTVIAGTTYTIIRDPPATGNNKRAEATALVPRRR